MTRGERGKEIYSKSPAKKKNEKIILAKENL